MSLLTTDLSFFLEFLRHFNERSLRQYVLRVDPAALCPINPVQFFICKTILPHDCFWEGSVSEARCSLETSSTFRSVG
jgi:hypothetical protein